MSMVELQAISKEAQRFETTQYGRQQQRSCRRSSLPISAGVRVTETALGDAQAQRRLPALESKPRAAACPRLLSLVASP